MGSLADLVRDLRTYEESAALVKQLRRELRKPLPAVRAAVRRRAVAILPRRGGLGAWVASLRINNRLNLSRRRARLTLTGGRNSTGGRSDLRRIDAGRVRAPAWGRRFRGQWHNQTVPSGFFTDPATETDAWRAAATAAIDEATEVIRRG